MGNTSAESMFIHKDQDCYDTLEDVSRQSVEPEERYGDNAVDDRCLEYYWSSQSTMAHPMPDETEGTDTLSGFKYHDDYFDGFLRDSSPVGGGNWSTFSKRTRSSSLNGILHGHEKRQKCGIR